MINHDAQTGIPVREMFITNLFKYSLPTEPIVKEGFVGATWGNVEPQPINKLFVRGMEQKVGVLGFQALKSSPGNKASIEIHPEDEETELTYGIQGRMGMTIQTPGEHPVTSHIQGPIPQGVDLQGAFFCIKNDGALVISKDDVNYVSMPTVTPVGSSHGTTPVSDECTYFVIKVCQ